MTSLSNGIHSEASLGNLPLQDGFCSAPPGNLKYKRRRDFAVRDFPPGTGPVCSHSTFRPQTEAGCLKFHEIFANGHACCDFKGDDSIQNSITETESSAKLVSDNLVQKEMVGVQNHLNSIDGKLVLPYDQINGSTIVTPVDYRVDRPGRKELESVELPTVEPVLDESDGASENSDDPHMLEPEEAEPLCNSLCRDETGSINDALKRKSHSNFPAEIEEIDLAHQQPLCSPLTGAADSGLGNTMKRSYPPRRKVSAVRDFPSFPGPNAARRSHEQVKELFSAENENLDTEKSVIKGVAALGYEKQRRIDTQEGSPEPVKLMKFEGKYAQKKSEKYGCGDDACGASNRTEVRREDMIKKIMVYQGSRNLGKEVSGLPGSANQSQSGKVVVKPLKAVLRKAERQISRREGKEIVLGCPAKRKNHYSGEISGQACGRPDSTKQLQSEKVVVKPLKVMSTKAETQVSRREGKEIVLGCPAKRSEFSVRMRGQRKSFSSRKEIKFQ